MSGGSFGYLADAVLSGELIQRRGSIQRMAEFLREEGFPSAADETLRVLESLDRALAHAEEMADVWQAAEWYRSGDKAHEDVSAAVKQWEARNHERIKVRVQGMEGARGSEDPNESP